LLDPSALNQKLYQEYCIQYKNLDEIEYDGDRFHLSCEDVLDAHYLICDHFISLGEGIAGFGPKDFGLLSSAVARQVASAGGSYVYHDIQDIVSSLIFGLINDHPFHDANKRTAFLSAVFFMMQNGYTPSANISDVEDLTVDIAEFNSKNNRNITVDEISSRLKSMFRKTDNRISYVVTFREIDSLLREWGCSLRNPHNNYIDVFRAEVRVAQIGFPGWKREVNRNAISTVRKKTGLTADNGYDAQVFFKGADPLKFLIGTFEEPLKRLAYR